MRNDAAKLVRRWRPGGGAGNADVCRATGCDKSVGFVSGNFLRRGHIFEFGAYRSDQHEYG